MFNEIINRYKSITNEENWVVKILIGAGLLYIPVFGWAVAFGFIMDLLINVKEKNERKLSNWQNFERLFMDGIPLVLFGLVAGLAFFIFSKILHVIPCIGPILDIILNLAFSIIMPAIIVIIAYRLKEFQNWQAAVSFGAITEDIKKDFNQYIPVLASFFIVNLIGFVIGCCIFSPLPLFFNAVVFYPMLGEIYLKSHTYESLNEPPKA